MLILDQNQLCSGDFTWTLTMEISKVVNGLNPMQQIDETGESDRTEKTDIEIQQVPKIDTQDNENTPLNIV